MKLLREIRCSALPALGPVTNGWAGWPPATRLAPYVTAQAVIEGSADPASGYLCNIKHLDEALRRVVLPLLASAGSATVEQLVLAAYRAASSEAPPGGRLSELRLRPTPYLTFATTARNPDMVLLTHSFEFSAAHRLYCRDLPERRNNELFGKCANPNGHGHNYLLEVTVRGRPDPQTGLLIDLARLEAVVKQQVIDRLDHRHLNLDCAEFGALNPSVENIAIVIWGLLDGRLEPAQLARVKVWETPKTCAEVEREGPS
jgi:6-pyruvoyltetrahydropterin/6-carboxytetrahydropterin synthase